MGTIEESILAVAEKSELVRKTSLELQTVVHNLLPFYAEVREAYYQEKKRIAEYTRKAISEKGRRGIFEVRELANKIHSVGAGWRVTSADPKDWSLQHCLDNADSLLGELRRYMEARKNNAEIMEKMKEITSKWRDF